jgi:hypothetical protein
MKKRDVIEVTVYLIVLVVMVYLMAGCGSVFKTNDSTQSVVQSGSSFSYVVVRLEFIQQIQQLCADSLLQTNYATFTLYKQAVASCTFDKLSSLGSINTGAITSFQQQYCQPNSDLSALTPQQVLDVKSACSALGF